MANALALVITAVGNTAANRRLTFEVRGRDGLARDHAAGLLALGVALAITSASLAILGAIAPQHGRLTEIAVLVVANVVATLVRFLLLRLAIDGGSVTPECRPKRRTRYALPVGKDTRMTAIARPASMPRIRPVAGLRSLVRGNADEADLGSPGVRRRARAGRGPVHLEPDRQRLREHLLLGCGAVGLAELVGLVLRQLRRGELHHRGQAAAIARW